ncbi:hypothetical protein [Natrinema sp. DC36]|uniref:hypothetical protein n=1 Tax=Natrinema sp. DC36 TaxID=2878680 RepID=UPI001CEFE78E|nr:hypothetical protein [Natrinema sp. DC36]
MSADTPPSNRWYCPDSVREHNQKLGCVLQRRWNMSLRVYKSIKALTELTTVAVVGFAISAGADPTISVIIAGAIVLGWEAVEALVADSDVSVDPEAAEAIVNAIDEATDQEDD